MNDAVATAAIAQNTIAQTQPLIRPRDRDALIQSLRSGVVPRVGQHLVQVGRVKEIEALIGDIERIADGGSSMRLIIGPYGAGKTFFMNLVRSMCLEKKMVVCNADLNPDRRLHATGGQARSLYSELVRNMSTRSKPEGNALGGIVERFIADCTEQATISGKATAAVIASRLAELTELVNGFDFSAVIQAYCRGFETDNDPLMQAAIRWLRGEYQTRTEARQALGVRTIVEDDTVYDHLKLMAAFVAMAGFKGMMVSVDEMVNLYKIPHRQARESNYEQILRILNDSLQGGCRHIGFIFGGTPEFLTDPRRGLFSYQALQSRLADNQFAQGRLIDFTGPVLRLSKLDQNDFFVLLKRIRNVYRNEDPNRYFIADDGIEAFMRHCAERVGEAYFRTPRETIRSFIDLLAVIEQNPGQSLDTLIKATRIERDPQAATEEATVPAEEDEGFAQFKL